MSVIANFDVKVYTLLLSIIMLFETFFGYLVHVHWISARSQPEGCTTEYIKPEPERQHRLRILSEHLYDSIVHFRDIVSFNKILKIV